MSETYTALIRQVIAAIGEEPDREGLKDTPARVCKSWGELYGGYRMDPSKILDRRFEVECLQPIVLRDIDFYSTCEHHMLPFFGKAHVLYQPAGKGVVGLSKLARLVECFARRLQIQERLTNQIGQALVTHLKPAGVAVVLEAQHFCMVSRGVMKPGAVMRTQFLEGIYASGREDQVVQLLGGRNG